MVNLEKYKDMKFTDVFWNRLTNHPLFKVDFKSESKGHPTDIKFFISSKDEVESSFSVLNKDKITALPPLVKIEYADDLIENFYRYNNTQLLEQATNKQSKKLREGRKSQNQLNQDMKKIKGAIELLSKWVDLPLAFDLGAKQSPSFRDNGIIEIVQDDELKKYDLKKCLELFEHIKQDLKTKSYHLVSPNFYKHRKRQTDYRKQIRETIKSIFKEANTKGYKDTFDFLMEKWVEESKV